MTDKEMLEAVRAIMKEELEPVKEDISSLKEDTAALKTDVAKLKTPANTDADATTFQSTADKTIAEPTVATNVCAIVFTALIPAFSNHNFQSLFIVIPLSRYSNVQQVH